MEKIDIVISVATKDCFIVQKNLEYIYNYLNPNNIYILTSIKNNILFNSKRLSKYNAIIIDENCLIDNMNFKRVNDIVTKIYPHKNISGWYFQQFLKMGFSLSKYANKEYLIWDADTFPLSRLIFKSKQQYYFSIKDEYHKPYFYSIKKLLGYDKALKGSFIAEHMIINVNIMRALISKIENSPINGVDWIEKILNSLDITNLNSFSEFETYGTYVMNEYPNIYIQQHLKTERHAGLIYGRCVSNKQLNKLSSEYDTVSFELRDYPPFPFKITHFMMHCIMKLLQTILSV